MSDGATVDLRRVSRLVVALNLGAFCVEVAVATAIGSVSLFADSVDFLEDASINILILIGLGWAAKARARLGMGLAGIILVPGLATLVMAWQRWASGTPPEPLALAMTGFGCTCRQRCVCVAARTTPRLGR